MHPVQELNVTIQDAISFIDADVTAVCHGSTTCPNGGTCQSPNQCSCRSGFASPACTDINECASNNGGCEQICTNTHGSFECSCISGYILNSDQKTCNHADTCYAKQNDCQQKCENLPGTFRCACNDGYALNTDGKTCRVESKEIIAILEKTGVAALVILIIAVFTCIFFRHIRSKKAHRTDVDRVRPSDGNALGGTELREFQQSTAMCHIERHRQPDSKNIFSINVLEKAGRVISQNRYPSNQVTLY